MLTRLVLLAALMLGVATPPAGGGPEHCRDHQGMMSDAAHDGMPMDRPVPPTHSRHRCPPADCLAFTHCSPGVQLSMTVAAATWPILPHPLTPRTAHELRGRYLEPPTPPPDKVT